MNDLNITLKQLRYYLVAAKHNSLRQAARELQISQPSLSAQLKSLEEALETVLFERNRGGVLLTPLGRQLLSQAQAAVAAAESIVETATFASHGPHGTYRLGVSPSVGPYVLPWILPAVHHKFREVKFFVREEMPTTLPESLTMGRADLILTTLPLEDPAITVMPLFREPIYLVMNADHPLAGNSSIKAEQLAQLEVLSIEPKYLFHKQVEDLCKRFRARLLRDYEGTSLDAVRQMVYMEMGVAFLPSLYIKSEIRDRDELKILRIEDAQIYRVHALAWRNSSPQRQFYRQLGTFFRALIEESFAGDVAVL